MKKIAILALSLLIVSVVLSFFIMHMIGKAAPGKIQFISTSLLWDPLVVYAAMIVSLMAVFTIILGTAKIISKKFKWGKWKTGLVCFLELLLWALIFFVAYAYSMRRTTHFPQAPAPLTVGPLMLSLKAFILYFLRNLLLCGVIMHLILCAGLFWVWMLKRKKQKRNGSEPIR